MLDANFDVFQFIKRLVRFAPSNGNHMTLQ